MPYASSAYRRRASSFRSDLSDFDRAVARVFLGMDEIHSDVVRERRRVATGCSADAAERFALDESLWLINICINPVLRRPVADGA